MAAAATAMTSGWQTYGDPSTMLSTTEDYIEVGINNENDKLSTRDADSAVSISRSSTSSITPSI